MHKLTPDAAAALTDAELIQWIREFGDRDALLSAVGGDASSIPSTITTEERSGLLPPSEPTVVECRDWQEFVAQTPVKTAWPDTPSSRLFRGQGRAEWLLSSEIERLLTDRISHGYSNSIYEAARETFLRPFMESSSAIVGPGARTYSEDEWWSLGRHFGLLTPLLDWSKSPYVAAFFAFVQYAEQVAPGFASGKPQGGVIAPRAGDQVAIWQLELADRIWSDGEFEFLAPIPIENSRQRAQQAVLTSFRHLQSGDLVSYLNGRGRGDLLTKLLVPATEFYTAMHDLSLMNIRFSTMFPDLTGSAVDANLGDRFAAIAVSPAPRVGTSGGGGLALPFSLYGRGMRSGARIEALKGATRVGEGLATSDGEWLVQIEPGGPGNVANGDELRITVDGRLAQETVIFQGGQITVGGLTLTFAVEEASRP